MAKAKDDIKRSEWMNEWIKEGTKERWMIWINHIMNEMNGNPPNEIILWLWLMAVLSDVNSFRFLKSMASNLQSHCPMTLIFKILIIKCREWLCCEFENYEYSSVDENIFISGTVVTVQRQMEN